MRRPIQASLIASLGAGAILVGCSIDFEGLDVSDFEYEWDIDFPGVGSVTILPSDSVVLAVGDSTLLRVVVRDTLGKVVPRGVVWMVRDTLVVRLLPAPGETRYAFAIAVGSSTVVAEAIFAQEARDSMLVIVR